MAVTNIQKKNKKRIYVNKPFVKNNLISFGVFSKIDVCIII